VLFVCCAQAPITYHAWLDDEARKCLSDPGILLVMMGPGGLGMLSEEYGECLLCPLRPFNMTEFEGVETPDRVPTIFFSPVLPQPHRQLLPSSYGDPYEDLDVLPGGPMLH
jgi:hypothetical protein